jgi:hypothetical protein
MKPGKTATVAVLSALLLGCSGTGITPESGTVVGTIGVIGNMPFTRVAIRVGERSSYVLLCQPPLCDSLRSWQGRLVKVRFRGSETVPEGPALNVREVELLPTIEHR